MSSVVINGDTSGSVTLTAPATAGTVTVTLPASSGTMAVTGASQSFTDITATGNLTVNGNTTLGDASTDTILMTGAPSIGGVGLGMGMGFRNRIINGAMVIDQRNAGASVTFSSGGLISYTLDRWNGFKQLSTGGSFTIQRSSTAPAGFINSTLVTITSSATDTGNNVNAFTQSIEGLNVADLGWGTANAQTVTLSFWVRSSVTGTYSCSLNNDGYDYSYVANYTINSANTWEQKTVTIAGPTAGTWLTTNGVGIRVWFDLGTGTGRNGTANTWTASQIYRTAGSVQLLANNGATWYVTGVQLEKGSTATSFDYRPYGTELALCQRYLPAITLTGSNAICSAYNTNTTTSVGIFNFFVTPRTQPTGITATAASGFSFSSAANFTASAIAFSDASPIVGKFTLTISGGTAGQGGYIFGSNGSQILWTGCEL